MDTYYINLESAEARRHSIEESFRQYGDKNGRLHRVEAVDAARVVADAVPGKISDTEKACFLSHRRAIDRSRRDGTHSLIVEDDVRFGPSTFKMFDKFGDTFDTFDIVFTDIDFCNLNYMFQFFLLRRELSRNGTFRLLDLGEIPFFGAAAYIVNARSKEKILGLIDGLSSVEFPYDIQLQNWVKSGCLKAGVAFPFLTTLSNCSGHSTIGQASGQASSRTWSTSSREIEMALSSYRKLIWMDFEQMQENPLGDLNKLDASCFDMQSLFFGQILSVLLSPKFSSQ
ncbi:MAG: glycosyltransferase family 25 protein [Candidatus Accumulibacter sp.]|jgi:GR25 family glycosyltransferase involved in LPS biosynthesis|nr:glycosyltransferase family 25 protein [Accumulibacter sp.]